MVIGRQSRTAASARRAAKLAQLRGDAASNGREWLGSALQDVNRKDVREFAQAAGLRVRKAGSDTWLSVGELRAALLEHLAPQQSVAPDEFGVFFCFVFRFSSYSRKVWPHRRGSEGRSKARRLWSSGFAVPLVGFAIQCS